jgi:hypothetical protein
MSEQEPDRIAAGLSVPERVLLFCVASGTDWVKAAVTGATVQVMLVKGLVERDRAPNRLVVTELGRAVLADLLKPSQPPPAPPPANQRKSRSRT